MNKCIIILAFIFSAHFLSGQCPSRDSIISRVSNLRDNKTAPKNVQLQQLLEYLKELKSCNYSHDSASAFLLQRIGILYNSTSEFNTAIPFLKQSIDIVYQQKKRFPKDQSLAIKSYYTLSLVYNSLHNTSKKYTALDSCISLASLLRTEYIYADGALGSMVPILFEMGDYYSCIRYAALAENITGELNFDPVSADEQAFTYFTWKINSLLKLKAFDEAATFLKNKIQNATAGNRKQELAALHGLTGTLLRNNNNATEALVNFQKCFSYNNQLKYNRGCGEALNNIGYTYLTSLHQSRNALPYFFKALKFSDANESLNIMDNIANAYFEIGKHDSAFYFFQKAFEQVKPGFIAADLLKDESTALDGNFSVYLTGMAIDNADAYFKIYKIAGNKKMLDKAIYSYEILDQYFEKLKISQVELQSKLFWKTSTRHLYEGAIEACYAKKDAGKAFYFFEKSRSILLNDEISEQQKMSEITLEQQAMLKKKILTIERTLNSTDKSSKDFFDLQQQLVTAKHELAQLVNNSSSTTSTKNISSFSPTIENVKKNILTNSRSLLEIFSGDSAVYLIAITASNTSFIKLNKQLYKQLTNNFITSLGDADKLNRNYKNFVNNAHQLYELIFKNIQLSSGGSLLISPDGKSFPYEALITNTDYNKPDYLLNHYATSYTYSAKYLMNNFAVNEKNPNTLLGIAPVKYPYNASLATLTGSEVSLTNIQHEFSNANIFTLGQATKNNFLKNFPDYAIIQLYTHAADSSYRNDPVIYFSDSAFYLSELMADRKPLTQLVILSACETANGKLYKGEGIFSFNRGFASLGIPAAVSNLWSVNNESTYRITELFYKYLAQGNPTDVALQKAKLEFIETSNSKEKKLPYYWAGTILVGKVDIIEAYHRFSWKTDLLITVILLLTIFTARKYWLRKKSNLTLGQIKNNPHLN
ncbi:MAG: CHAT domain-containing protein [Ferruginibacter sp.]